MKPLHIGDIPLEDYMQLTGHAVPGPAWQPGPRRRYGRLAAKVGAVVALCLSCVAAGSYLRPLDGRNTLDQTFDDGLRAMQHARNAEELYIHMGSAFNGGQLVIDRLAERALEPKKIGVYAVVALRNLTTAGMKHLLQLEQDHPARPEIREAVDLIREIAKNSQK